MLGWYSRFIKGESGLKIPLVRMFRKGREWSWGEKQDEAFEQLKRALATAPVLARPDFSKPFKVQCDVSGFALGAVLRQESGDGEHQKNYTTTEKECLAMVWSIKKLRSYLEGYKFTVVTDHSALRWLCNLKEQTSRFCPVGPTTPAVGFRHRPSKGDSPPGARRSVKSAGARRSGDSRLWQNRDP